MNERYLGQETSFTLYIGTQNISSWSLRPWLMLNYLDVHFKEILIPLQQPDSSKRIKSISPSSKVPVLKHNNLLIWDSLAICEYLAELFPDKNLWPKDPHLRAHARAISAEMHSGFQELRKNLPMNIRLQTNDFVVPDGATGDIQRILTIWQNCLEQSNGPFLFGNFTIADAMFAPVVTRFKTYGVTLPLLSENYAAHIYNLPMMQKWREACINKK